MLQSVVPTSNVQSTVAIVTGREKDNILGGMGKDPVFVGFGSLDHVARHVCAAAVAFHFEWFVSYMDNDVHGLQSGMGQKQDAFESLTGYTIIQIQLDVQIDQASFVGVFLVLFPILFAEQIQGLKEFVFWLWFAFEKLDRAAFLL